MNSRNDICNACLIGGIFIGLIMAIFISIFVILINSSYGQYLLYTELSSIGCGHFDPETGRFILPPKTQ